MQLIETKTLGTASASIEFASIPQNFTDIRVVCSLRSSNSLDGQNYGAVTLAINGSTANLSRRNLIGLGSGTPESYSGTSISVLTNGSTSTSNTFTNSSIYFPNYAGATNKSMSFDLVMENNGTLAFQEIMAGLWSQTAAITSLTFTASGSGATLVAGSTISLYGIGGVGEGYATPKATGGVISYTPGYVVHTFYSSGTFTPTTNLTNVEYVVVAGGGAGGGYSGGGGGAGGYRSSVVGESSGGGASAESRLSLTSGTNYTVTVGAGGTRQTGTSAPTNGSDSVFGSITSVGGGRGSIGGGGTGWTASVGGSGGGGASSSPGGYQTGAAGTTNQGYAGGNSPTPGGNYPNGGGGGAGAVGGSPATNSALGGNGGVGVASAITGTSIFRAGGGGGANADVAGNTAGVGGNGGGGNGSYAFVSNGQYKGGGSDGSPNTGGGGGGGNQPGTTGGWAGGSGIVIVRYAA